MAEDGMNQDALAAGAFASLLAVSRGLFRSLAQGEWSDSQGLVSYASGLPMPRFNGVVVHGPGADEGTAAGWLDDLAFRDLPHAILSRPASPSWVAPLAAAYGLTTVEHEPLMCHTHPAVVATAADARAPGGLVIDVVDPSDAQQLRTAQQLMADGFEAPVDLLAPFMGADLLAAPGMSGYVGRVDGEPCTVGLGAVTEGHVGVFNIATPPQFRRRGFGQAVTARIVADGVREGAHTAYLQSSPMGLSVYERIGFRTVETWANYYPG
jgi:ribosomal protein S18 acetylase RimI-like enzyme